MKTPHLIKTVCLICLFLPPLVQASASEGMEVSTTEAGETILTFQVSRVEDMQKKAVKVTFTLPEGKGVLGPSTDSGDQAGFSNREETIFAVNHQPATKSSYVYLILKEKDGGIGMIGNVNEKIAKLLPREQGRMAEDFIQIEQIDGRVLTCRIVDFISEVYKAYQYQVEISEHGILKLK